MQFDLIVSVDCFWGIAKNGIIPWANAPAGYEDKIWFKKNTSLPKTALIMGRITRESIPANFFPLSKRINIVVSSAFKGVTELESDPPVVNCDSFASALDWCKQAKIKGRVEQVFVIGGNIIYEQALQSPHLRFAHISVSTENYFCDKIFPFTYIKDKNYKIINRNINEYRIYDFSNIDEINYQSLLNKLLAAPSKPNRTGIATRSLFHEVLKFKLYESGRRILPLLQIRKLPFNIIYHELIWFLRASTDTSYLKENNVKIWDANSSREFLDNAGLYDYAEGELGPIYGFQWRKWNAPFRSKKMQEKYINHDIPFIPLSNAEGIDQLNNIIKTLKTNPWDRRMLVTAWNPEQLTAMALPPCHYSFQFVVDPDESGSPAYLNCIVNMRSADVALGVPFNIALYALLTHFISHITKLLPGTLSISMADCHIYENHIAGIQEMLTREPRRFPTLQFGPKILLSTDTSIDDFAKKYTINDLIISGYDPHPAIRFNMAV